MNLDRYQHIHLVGIGGVDGINFGSIATAVVGAVILLFVLGKIRGK